MKFTNLFFLLVASFLIFTPSCQKDETGITGPDPEEEMEDPDDDALHQTLGSEVIFDQDKLHTFELTLTESALAQINSDPAKEEYVVGSLTFNGETISPVGIRYKGSIGAYVGCLSGLDWTNPSGHKTCTKLSMKVKINWNDSDKKFYGLKKLQFHSQNHDDSQMRERIGYWFFREMGVPAPRSVHARLIINGVYSGVYALTEQIDGRFARHNFDDGSGNIYKEIWPINSNGQPYAEQVYLNNLKTNEDENPSAAMIRSFGSEIANSTPENIQSIVSKWMDVNEIISYAVVDRTIRHDDGPFHWYCDGGSCNNHNYYWYEEPTLGSLHLIPWDLDNAFENIISDANPVTPIADEWGEITANCNIFAYGPWGIPQRSAACDKLIGAWTMFEDEYSQFKDDFINGPFSETQVNSLIDSWSAQIHEATTEAAQEHNDAISVNTWQNAINDLKTKLDFARNK